MIPAMSGIRLNAQSGSLRLAATDGDISLEAELDANVEMGGDVVVPGRLLTDVVRQLPSGNVTISQPDGTNTELVSGNARFHIRLLPTDDFPEISHVDGDAIELPTAEFTETVDRVRKAASRDETRPHLTGILLSLNDGKLRTVATDSYRLAVKTTDLPGDTDETVEANVPARALDEAVRIASTSDSVSITPGERQIQFSSGRFTLMSRLIDGQFPDFEQLLPDSYEHELDIDREELLDAVKRVGLMAQRNTPLKLAFTDGELTISAETADIGAGTEQMPLTGFSGEAFEIGFNADFLRDGLESAATERITFKLISPFRPGLLESGESGDFLYLVMPIRLNV
jgi:DNA polymerase-3 subunit beta